MEIAGIFRNPSAKEMMSTKGSVERQEKLQKKATEGADGGKLRIEDMMHRPKR